jgi:hypothetical protein
MGLPLGSYLTFAALFLASLALGRRGFCHTLCWMAPFTGKKGKMCRGMGSGISGTL